MPYIEPERRRQCYPGTTAQNCGELNYMLTMLVLELDDMRGAEDLMVGECMKYLRHKGMKYQHANDVVGACICAMFEYNRRTGSHKFDSLFMDVAKRFYFRDGRVGDYEDTKIAANGDLDYPLPADPVQKANAKSLNRPPRLDGTDGFGTTLVMPKRGY